jgi:serine/threonine protein kinase/WD40 repeat protein
MSEPSLETFLATLRRANLLASEGWAVVGDLLADKSTAPGGSLLTAGQLSAALVERGLLTGWQAEMLLEGKQGFYLGKYRLLDRLGTGGMGAVFKAEQIGLGRTVAIKLLARELVRDRDSLARFHQEIQVVASLNHRHIVTALDADAVGETHFLVMEYVPGNDLGSLLNQHGPPPVEWACECVRQAALGLQHAYERGMVHRDIKPSNLLIGVDSETGRPLVKILDLGLARCVSETRDDRGLTQTGQVLGTPDYISPEQASDTRAADIRSDLFSLGVSFFRLLTGRLPYSGNNVMEKLMARAMQPAPRVERLQPGVPTGVADIVARLLERDPGRRFSTPAELANALEGWCRNPSLVPWPPQSRSGSVRIEDLPDTSFEVEEFLSKLATEHSPVPEKPAPVPVAPPTSVAAPRALPPRRPSKPAASGKPARHTIAWRTRVFGATLLVALVGLVGLVAYSVTPRTPAVALLRIDWPPGAFEGARLLIDGEVIPLEPDNRMEWRGPPGDHRLVAMRAGYPPLDVTLTLTGRKPTEWSPDWDAAEGVWLEGALRDVDQRWKRGVPGDASGAASLREQIREILERAPLGSHGPLLAAKLSELAWPLDDLPTTALSLEERRERGWLPTEPAPRGVVALFGDARLRHAGEVTRLATNPAGTVLASLGRDRMVRLWNPTTGEPTAAFPHADDEARLEIAPAGEHLLVSGERGVFLWNVKDQVRSFESTDLRAPARISPDGARFAALDPARGVVLCDRADPARQVVLAVGTRRVRTLSWSANGNHLAVETDAGAVIAPAVGGPVAEELPGLSRIVWHGTQPVWSAATNRGDTVVRSVADTTIHITLEEAGEPVRFLGDDERLLTRRVNRLVEWDWKSGRELRTVTDAEGLLAVTADGRTLVTADEGFGSLRLRGRSPREDVSIPAHVGRVTDLALAVGTGGGWLASSGADGRVRLWNVDGGTERVVSGAGIVAGDVSPDGRQLLLATDEGSLRVWDVTARQSSRVLVSGAREIRTCDWSGNGRYVSALGDWGYFRATTRVWDATTGTEISLRGNLSGNHRVVRFSPIDSRVAIANDQRSVTIFRLPEGTPAEVFEPQADVLDIAFSPSADEFAISLKGRRLLVQSLSPKGTKADANTANGSIHRMAYRPFHNMLFHVSDSAGTAGLLDMSTSQATELDTAGGRPLRGVVACYSWRPAGDWLAAGMADGTIRMASPHGDTSRFDWPPTVTAGLRWGQGTAPLRALRFAPDGRHLLIVSGQGLAAVVRLAERD